MLYLNEKRLECDLVLMTFNKV